VLRTYVAVTLLLRQPLDALRRRADAGRRDDTGLATLEWVALAIVAVTLATGASIGIKAVIDRKISEIP
jgi:hypothetical protein